VALLCGETFKKEHYYGEEIKIEYIIKTKMLGVTLWLKKYIYKNKEEEGIGTKKAVQMPSSAFRKMILLSI